MMMSAGASANDDSGNGGNPVDSSPVFAYLATAKEESLNVDDRIEAIRYLQYFKFQDVVDGFLAILKSETAKDLSKINIRLLVSTIESLAKTATVKDYPSFNAAAAHIIKKLMLNKEAVTLVSAKDGLKLHDAISYALNTIESNHNTLEYLPQPAMHLAALRLGHDKDYSLKTELETFAKILRENIKGQPHVVQKLIQLRSRDLFYGYRENPAFMWFLGPPGTGKDTAVRAYLRAANNNNAKAYQAHMYRVDPLRSEGDLWSLLGSSTGYIGSENLPPILKFLVYHSGGRYKIVEIRDPGDTTGQKPVKYKIEENKSWQPGDLLPGYASPESGIVYLDEFHDWSESLKNAVVKKAVEYGGYWKVNNPNGGVSQIYVPITITAASNNGLGLVTSRDEKGARFGKPLGYKQMLEKTDRVRNDPVALRGSILGDNQPKNIQDAKGTSEELLNRIPDDYLVLFDPLSPEQLKEIAESKLAHLQTEIANSKKGYSTINLTWTKNVVDFIQEYHYVAEDQARPIETRVRSLIEDTLIRAATEDLIKPNSPIKVEINATKQSDNTWSMTFTVNDTLQAGSSEQVFSLPILETEKDKFRQPISDQEIDELIKIGPALRSGVVGQSNALNQIAQMVMLSQEGRGGMRSASEATENARTIMLLGPTSTGKTETAKVIAEILHKDRGALVTLQCTSIQTVEQMHRLLFGYKDAQGHVTPSDFMRYYDRNNGHLVVVFDEISNAPKEVLNALFDILREPVVTLFADGKERAMANVFNVLTGNASQEILEHLPDDVPEDILREAWSEIYDRLESDPLFRRKILEKYFAPPFIARVGDDRIFFYKPLNYADVRVLAQMKLEQLIDKLEATDTARGWPIRFANKHNYMIALEALEQHGFKIKEQGASIHNYIFEVFGKKLHETLLTNKIPTKEAVTIQLDRIVKFDENTHAGRHQLIFKLQTVSGKNLQFEIDGKPILHTPETQKSDQLLTSGHEAGHTIVALALLSDFELPKSIRISPGLADIGGEWIYYAGLAESQDIVRPKYTLDYILRRAAVLLGGTAAESLIVKGGINSAGRANDIQRATALLENAVLKFGMSKKFGMVVRDKNNLSTKEREILDEEVRSMMEQAMSMATKAIVANRTAFTELTNQLGLKSELNASEIRSVFTNNNLTRETDRFYSIKGTINSLFFNSKNYSDRPGLKYEFVSTLGLIKPEAVADIGKIVSDKKKKQLETVQLPDNFSILNRKERSKKSACMTILTGN